MAAKSYDVSAYSRLATEWWSGQTMRVHLCTIFQKGTGRYLPHFGIGLSAIGNANVGLASITTCPTIVNYGMQ